MADFMVILYKKYLHRTSWDVRRPDEANVFLLFDAAGYITVCNIRVTG
ncbi:MAG: hypothetical protein Q4D16_23565 [Eubacteriales bacterium]|nr:hypothetical protein [Eubacteriales bacterium]